VKNMHGLLQEFSEGKKKSKSKGEGLGQILGGHRGGMGVRGKKGDQWERVEKELSLEANAGRGPVVGRGRRV